MRHHKGARARRRREREKKQLRMLVLIGGLIAIFAYSVYGIVAYGRDYQKSKEASEALRAAYYAITSVPTMELSTPTPTPGLAVAAKATVAAVTPVPTQYVSPNEMQPVAYPDNPKLKVQSRFSTLQRQNKDIIGWLNIEDLLDEAVVQRDNSYYLRRDYRGYHNTNGSIFLEQTCDLSSRPYTLMLYGHNMKTGAMFGCLRNYENINFYHNNPFITFDTAYENGKYVIFSVGTVSLTEGSLRYVDFGKVSSTWLPYREEGINALISRSIYSCTVDVQPEDQLLLLVTCSSDDEERRVIAARRIRDGESEEALRKAVKNTISQ